MAYDIHVAYRLQDLSITITFIFFIFFLLEILFSVLFFNGKGNCFLDELLITKFSCISGLFFCYFFNLTYSESNMYGYQGLQRFCTEHKIKLSKVWNVHDSWLMLLFETCNLYMINYTSFPSFYPHLLFLLPDFLLALFPYSSG